MKGSILILLPGVILAGGAFLVYLFSRLLRLGNKAEALITAVILVCALVSLIFIYVNFSSLLDDECTTFGIHDAGGIVFSIDALGLFILIIGIAIGIMVTLYSGEYLSKDHRYVKYYPLVLLILSGLVGMFMSRNLFNLFLLTEFVTVIASALISFRFYQEIAIKAGFKYLIMSSIGTMMMLLGIYFVFRSTGSLDITTSLSSPDNFSRIGAASFLIGFSLKAGVVPLHTWVPDVYGHAPSAVSGLLAGVISKSMLFITPGICLPLGMSATELGAYLMVFACLNMAVGSIRMLRQTLFRRFLSYSSIAQTGYLMFALGLGLYYMSDQAMAAALFLFLIIAVMKTLAFLSAGTYAFYYNTQDMNHLSGMGSIMKITGFATSTALAGLAGIPLLAGFTGKWLAFSAAFETGDAFAIICLVIFLLTTVIGLGGYLPAIVKQYRANENSMIRMAGHTGNITLSKWMSIPILALTAIVISIGFYPTPSLNFVRSIVEWIVL